MQTRSTNGESDPQNIAVIVLLMMDAFIVVLRGQRLERSHSHEGWNAVVIDASVRWLWLRLHQ